MKVVDVNCTLLALVASICCGYILGTTQQRDTILSPKEVRAQAFVLVDTKGRECARLSQKDTFFGKATVLCVKSPNSKQNIEIVCTDLLAIMGIGSRPKQGYGITLLSSNNKGSSVALVDESGNQVEATCSKEYRGVRQVSKVK